ncbi:MAG: acyl-CoA dehydrogenase family protein, partial [Myxococcales bacterium]
MNLAFDEAQQELRSQARAFLAEHSGSEQIRAAMTSELGFDRAVWKQLSAELGWTALSIPEAYGGLGLGPVELIALTEVMGEALLCAPFFSSVCLGAQALLVAASEAQKRAFLPAIA